MDLTREAFKYCEARRHLWNNVFSGQIESITDPAIDGFIQIQKWLLKSLVLDRCGATDYELVGLGVQPLAFLCVRIATEIDAIKIFVSRTRHPTKWEEKILKREDWEHRRIFFIDFFDWYPQDPKGRCSYPFVEAEVDSIEEQKTNERWLIPNEYVSIHYRSLAAG